MTYRRCFGLLLALASLSCSGGGSSGTSHPPEQLDLQVALSPATGLVSGDYDLVSPVVDTYTPVAGTTTITTYGRRAGLLVALPRDGTPTAARLAASTGFYAAPALGPSRITGTPGAYRVSDDGTATIDAGTTIIAVILMHPTLATPFPPVLAREADWLATRANAGWPAFDQARTLYDASLAAGTDPFDATQMTAALGAMIDEIGVMMPAFEPVAEDDSDDTLPVPLRLVAAGDPVPVTVTSNRQEVGYLDVGTATDTLVPVEPKTRVGTALEYYYVIRRLSDSQFEAQGVATPSFQSPDALVILPSTDVVAQGFIAARSYWSYVDIVGNTLQWVTQQLGTPLAPVGPVDMTARHVYEVRLFSGGYGFGNSNADSAFVAANFPAEAKAAFRHNAVMGAVEILGLIPGAELALGDDTGRIVVTAAIQQSLVEVEALLSAKNVGDVTPGDVYNCFYNTLKAAVDKFVEKAGEEPLKAGWKKAFDWLKRGGTKAIKTIMSVPGKIAKGGSVANRAFRLARPHSITEYFMVAVGYTPVKTFPLSIQQKVNGAVLGEHGNAVSATVSGTVLSDASSFAAVPGDGVCVDLGDYFQCTVVVKVNAYGKAPVFDITFSEPPTKIATTYPSGTTAVTEWGGYLGVAAEYQDVMSGHTVAETVEGGSYHAHGYLELPGAKFTAAARVTTTYYDADGNSEGTENTTDDFIVEFN